jgi:hypothetical protein
LLVSRWSKLLAKNQQPITNNQKMDRRKYLKTLAVGSLSAAALLQTCSPAKNEEAPDLTKINGGHDRQPNEIEHFKKIFGCARNGDYHHPS